MAATAPPPPPGFEFARWEATVYQCSGCRYSSCIKTHVVTHQRAKCPAATVVQHRCALFSRPVEEQALPRGGVGVTGNHNVVTTGDNNINITVNVLPNNMVYVGSEEEKRRLFEVFKDPEALRELEGLAPHEIPAALFRLWKGADAPGELHNIRVVGNKVHETRGPGQVVSVPRTKFVKKTVGDMFDTVSRADAEALEEVREELARPSVRLGKKRAVSKLDAVRMHVSGSKEAYDLDTDARAFIRGSSDLVDRELDHYAADAAHATHAATHSLS